MSVIFAALAAVFDVDLARAFAFFRAGLRAGGAADLDEDLAAMIRLLVGG